MRFDGPSLTAPSAARHRAIHQVLDGGAIFEDPVALALLGLEPNEVDPALRADRSSQRMWWFIAARSRFAEDRARAAIRSGLSQVVVLGAGLDSFAYRLTSDLSVTVFEVDHLATQAWKRERLDAARVEATTTVVYVPVDFETDDAFDALSAGGFNDAAPAMFLWLGVVPYLTLDAIGATLCMVARVLGADVVFDYGEPVQAREPARGLEDAARARRVEAIGEPWLTSLTPGEVSELLERTGLRLVEDVDIATFIGQLLSRPTGDGRTSAAHFVHASADVRPQLDRD
jgi:methyltransferase (TIGR00027 family)